MAFKLKSSVADADENDYKTLSSSELDSCSENEEVFVRSMATLDLDFRRKIHEEIVNSAKSAYELFIDRSKNTEAGWGLFTKEDIPAGVDIFVKPIFAHAVDPESWKVICDGCFFILPEALKATKCHDNDNPQEERLEAMEVCVSCRSVAYCSKACAAKAWESYHRFECKVAPKLGDYANFPESWRICVRLLLQQTMREDFGAKWQQIQVLESHLDRIERNSFAEFSASALQKLFCDAVDTSISSFGIRELLYRISVNQAGLIITAGYQAGGVFDPLLSMINHDCSPKAYTPICDGGSLRLRSACPIAAGEEITVSYIDTGFDVKKRSDELTYKWHFTCHCIRCIEEQTRDTEKRGNNRIDVKAREELIDLQPWLYSGDKSTCHFVESELKRIMMRTKPHYPAHIHPVPNIMYSMAKVCQREGDCLDGLKFILRCVLFEREDVMLHLTSWELLASIWKRAPGYLFRTKENKDQENVSDKNIDRDRLNHDKAQGQSKSTVVRAGVRKKNKKQTKARKPSPSPSAVSSATDEEQAEPWVMLVTSGTFKKMEARVLMKGYFLHWWKLAAKIYGPDSTYLVGWKSRFEGYDLWTNLPKEDSETFAKLFYQAQKKLLDFYDITQEAGIKLEAAKM